LAFANKKANIMTLFSTIVVRTTAIAEKFMFNWFVLNSQEGKFRHFPRDCAALPRVFRKPIKRESPLKNKMLKTASSEQVISR